MLSVTPASFRAVLAQFATGVGVMTSASAGVPHGMTVNALASVSLQPLLVLVCVERDSIMAGVVAEAGVFGLSLLTADQRRLSDHFANPDRPEGDEQFTAVPYDTAETGAPLLEEALAWIDCRVWALHDGGDHVIVVGEVLALDFREDAEALVYFRSGYGSLPAARDAVRG